MKIPPLPKKVVFEDIFPGSQVQGTGFASRRYMESRSIMSATKEQN